MAEPPVVFAGLLRTLRTKAGLTQEQLAEAASLSSRAVSDLERGINLTARKETARLLADALNLTGPSRAEFEAIARGRIPAGGYQVGAAAPPGVAAATRTLPRDIASFTGREPELRELVEAEAGAAGSGAVVSIHAIGGMAGVGKTAFAVHAAHQLAPRFPDGQIFLPLHGHTPGQRPVDPVDALANLLMTAGVPAQQIPSGLEERMALWRDRLAGRQLLLVLDDAADSEQVRPLLPGAGGSLVLVTSRRHLSALEDARSISLDTLPPDEAADLLARLADRPGLSPDDESVGEITRVCGYLPLAIGMLAGQLHHHPAWTPADLAADLAAARDRLDLMKAENLSVAAAFNLSYEDLTDAQRRLFRRLGLHPGTDIDAYAAAALDDTNLETARRHLQALYDQYLLSEPVHGRYRLHDLIREHAHTLAAPDPDGDREQAIDRLLDYYQYTAEIAGRRITRYTRPGSATRVDPPTAVPDLPDGERALSWARAERANLLACLDYATRIGLQARVADLTAAVAALLRHDGPWSDAILHHTTAVQAARDIEDQLGHANSLHDLGVVRYLTGDYPDAAEALETSLGICRDIGNRLGQANALHSLGVVRRRIGDYSDAAEALETSLGICRDIGDRLGQANALNDLGIVRRLVGDYPDAAEALEESLGICRDIGDRLGHANALISLGAVRYQTGDYLGAADAFKAALSIYRDIGDRLGQASALRFLGAVWRLSGDYSSAAEALEAALDISLDIGDRLGYASALDILGMVRRLSGDYTGAAEILEAALGIARSLGDRLGQANSLCNLGIARRLTGDYSGATDALATALGIFRSIGDRAGEVDALNEVGALHRVMGDLGRAAACHQQALDLAREIDSPLDEAHALAGLGRCALAASRIADAQASMRQALEIFQRIGSAEAAEVSAELDALRAAGQAEQAGA